MKNMIIACGALAMLIGPAAVSAAQAQSAVGTWRYQIGKKHVRADGRCRGISYGTGARSCGTMTGGPVGGLSSRN